MISARILEPALLGAAADPLAPVAIDLGAVGRCPGRPTLVIGIVDDSGSVTAPGGADPISNRYGELELALRAVARVCRCRQELAAIVHFDSPAGDTPALPLSKRGLAGLRRGLQISAEGRGTSDLLPALQRATELAEGHPDHQAVVMVFSDFALTDADPGAVAAALNAFPGVVYGCVLGRDPGALPGVVHQVRVGPTSSPGAVARALLAALTHHRTAGDASSGGRRGRFHNALTRLWLPVRSADPTSGADGRPGRRAGRFPERGRHGNP